MQSFKVSIDQKEPLSPSVPYLAILRTSGEVAIILTQSSAVITGMVLSSAPRLFTLPGSTVLDIFEGRVILDTDLS